MSELSGQPLRCIEGDVRNSQTLKRLFANAEADGTPIEAVITSPALKPSENPSPIHCATGM